MINIENLTVTLNNKYDVIKNVSLSVNTGETVAIVGESGCGKSVLTKSIVGLLPETMSVTSGKILWNNENLLEKDKKQLRKILGKEISLIPQNPMTSLDATMTIGNQIGEVIKIHNKKISKAELKDRTLKLMEEVHLKDSESVIKKYPHELSGGMRQRVIIAIAIANNPKFLIADEPTTALDVTTQLEILLLLKEIQEKYNIGILFISHNLKVVDFVAHRIITMYAGEIVETGKVSEVFESPCHPYTKALLESLPSETKKGEQLKTIDGSVIPLKERKSGENLGCLFYNRCELKSEECKQEIPYIKNDSRMVKCINTTISV